MSLRPNELLIGNHNAHQFVQPQIVGGEHKARGLVPRNYATHPRGYYGSAEAIDFALIPRPEWSARIADMVAQQSRLSDIRLSGNAGQPIPSRDQNGKGYCWFHSGTTAVILTRAVANLPYVSLSAYAGACVIKNFRDEGGWGAEGVDFLTQRGVPSEEFWPQQSMSRSNDNPTTWANAKLHCITEGFVDLAAAQYDRNLTFDQVGTLLLSRNPVVVDYNWWSHSVCAMDLVDGSGQRSVTRAESGKLATVSEFESMWGVNDPVTAGFGVRIWNSWGDSWSDRGMGVLTGSQAVSDGAVAPRSSVPSVV